MKASKCLLDDLEISATEINVFVFFHYLHQS